MSAPVSPTDPLAAPATTLLDVRTRRALDGALLVVAGLAVGIWLFLAVAHLHDRYGDGHRQGAWMALAKYANEGVLYPPVYDGQHYGGTRWMPIPILVNAAAARITGEYLTSGKVVGIVSMALLLVIVFLILRRFSCPWPLAAALTAAIVATQAGRLAGTTLGGDVSPVVFQVAALMAAAAVRRRWLPVAGVLAALAFASKLTGIWAALGILTYLALRRRWRDLIVFGTVFALTSVVVLGLVDLASAGRFAKNLSMFAFAGVSSGIGPIRAPSWTLFFLTTSGLAVWALLPFAFLGAIVAPDRRLLGPWYPALGWALLLLLVTYTDPGASSNHLLDVIVLGVLAVGHLAGRLNLGAAMTSPLGVAVMLVVLWVVGSGVGLLLLTDVRPTLRHDPLGATARPLVHVIHPGDTILAEDPYVPLSFGLKPVVLDAFMLRYLDRVDPTTVDPLIERIERKEFDHVVLEESLDPVNDYYWEQFDFGLRVADAMRRAYVFQGLVDGYYLYKPAP